MLKLETRKIEHETTNHGTIENITDGIIGTIRGTKHEFKFWVWAIKGLRGSETHLIIAEPEKDDFIRATTKDHVHADKMNLYKYVGKVTGLKDFYCAYNNYGQLEIILNPEINFISEGVGLKAWVILGDYALSFMDLWNGELAVELKKIPK